MSGGTAAPCPSMRQTAWIAIAQQSGFGDGHTEITWLLMQHVPSPSRPRETFKRLGKCESVGASH